MSSTSEITSHIERLTEAAVDGNLHPGALKRAIDDYLNEKYVDSFVLYVPRQTKVPAMLEDIVAWSIEVINFIESADRLSDIN